PIFTIHGFCQRILVDNAFAQQRLFDEEVVAGEEVYAAAFADALRHDIAPDAGLAGYLTGWLQSGREIGWLRDRILLPGRQEVSRFHPPRMPILPDELDEAGLAAALERFAAIPFDPERLKWALKPFKINSRSLGAAVDRLGKLRALAEAIRQ